MPRTIVVTGSGSGLGAALATLFRDRGDRVIGVDLRGGEIDADLSTAQGRARAAGAAPPGPGGVVDPGGPSAGVSGPGEAK
ncbi:short-chain dehydrogenase, partial [Streptomyces diastaticus]